MPNLVLITGGAGFIGSELARVLIYQGVNVRILDNFSPQIHANDILPIDISPHVELFRGDIRDSKTLKDALRGVDSLVHYAAETGTGQSMYKIAHYFDVNVQATASMLQLIQDAKCGSSLSSVVIASSRAVYGEGAYRCLSHDVVFPIQRSRELMSAGNFDPICPICGSSLTLFPTREDAPFSPMSIYGFTKQIQEQAILMFARTRGINAFGLRYQNVYGPGQSLKNPYTGILAIFSNLARQNLDIEIYEDGLESRDFVYIDEVVAATVQAILYSGKFVGALNVGSGIATSVMTVAKEVCGFFGSKSCISVTGNYRIGDIRHNIADISSISSLLHFEPKVSFSQGLTHFLNWASGQPLEDRNAYIRSVAELCEKGFMLNVK